VENMFFEPSYWRYMRLRGYSLWRTIEFNEVYVRRSMLRKTERLVARLRSMRRRASRWVRGSR
jgi:hypothetical protein